MKMAFFSFLFFALILDSNFELTFYRSGSENIELLSFGEYLYDNVLIMMPSEDDLGSLSVPQLVEFMKEGGNLLVATSSEISDSIRELGAECGVEFDTYESNVIDHFLFDRDLDSELLHTAVGSVQYSRNEHLLPSLVDSSDPVIYRGIGHAVDSESVLPVHILQGNPSSYSANPREAVDGFPDNAGTDTLLVSGIQVMLIRLV